MRKNTYGWKVIHKGNHKSQLTVHKYSMLFLNHIQCWARVVRRLHGKKNGLAHERKYVANNCQCTIAASACCMVLYLSNLVHLVGCVWRKTLLSDICSTICKINVCFRANNVCFAVTWQSSTIKKKTFPWTQRTPLKRQFVERTAAWFWSHWWMVPKTNHLFVCKKNANKSCSCPPVINPMRLHEREQIKFEDRFHTFWNRTFAIQTPLWFPNGTANRFEFSIWFWSFHVMMQFCILTRFTCVGSANPRMNVDKHCANQHE